MSTPTFCKYCKSEAQQHAAGEIWYSCGSFEMTNKEILRTQTCSNTQIAQLELELKQAKAALEKARRIIPKLNEEGIYEYAGVIACGHCGAEGPVIKHREGCIQPEAEEALTAINEVLDNNSPSTSGPLPAPNKEQSNHK